MKHPFFVRLSLVALSTFASIFLSWPAHASGLKPEPKCDDILEVKSGLEALTLTPHRTLTQPNETLSDPFISFAVSNESFRQYLLSQIKSGRAVISDFKQIADATPKYSVGAKPQVPILKTTGQPATPYDLSFAELVDYISTNYVLGGADHAFVGGLALNQKVNQHPLDKAMVKLPLLRKATRDLHNTWDALTRQTMGSGRGTLLSMPNPYIVPGGRFRETYFWDSLWAMKGLVESGYGSMAKGMLENFVYLFETYRIIPNGNRYYYLTRTQPPVLLEMVELLVKNNYLDFKKNGNTKQSLEWRILKASRDYYQSIWRGTQRYRPNYGLFAYSDDAGGKDDAKKVVVRPESGIGESREEELHAKRVYAESGWDMCYSRFQHDPQDWMPVELSALLVGYTSKLSTYFGHAGRTEDSNYFFAESNRIKREMNLHLFDSNLGIFMDRNMVTNKLSTTISVASFFPFQAEMYEHNDSTQRTLRTLFRKLKPRGHSGLHTTDKEGPGQWDGSWTWAPTNEVAFQALLKYGLIPEAKELALDYSAMVIAMFYKHNHKFFEKYRAEDGSIKIPAGSEIYGNEEGFGWTNGTLAVFLKELSKWGMLPTLEKEVAKRLSTIKD